MTMPIIISIVICLIVLVVLIYIFLDKTKMSVSAMGCEPTYCKLTAEDCDSGFVKGFTPCSKEVDTKKVTGRCCVKEEPG
ncbi:hypothetical protein HZB90_00380 [archaeon]|nr:hypothetical protein [archaeon]